MAFVSGGSIVGGKVGAAKNGLVAKQVPVARKSVVMMAEKDDKPRPGFNINNEQLNGRLAMMGFVIGLATEVINPNHPTIVQQVMSVIGQ